MAGVKGRSGMNPNSKKNLLKKPAENMTHEQLVESGRKGGIASGESKRKKKEMRELIQDILTIGCKKGEVVEDFDSLEEAKGKNLTVGQMLVIAQVKKAMAGDTRALEFLRDTAGQKPADKKEVTAKVGVDPLVDIMKQLTEEDEEEKKEEENKEA